MILTLTMNPSLDKSARTQNIVPERKTRCHALRFDPGGGGINVARAVLKLGGEAVAIYPAGGAAGAQLTAMLCEEELPTRPVPIARATRENLTVFEEATTLQYRFNMPGPELDGAEWRRCLSTLTEIEPGPTHVVASGSLPPGVPADFFGQLADRVGARGARLVVDTSGTALGTALERGVFLIKPNLAEFQRLTGRELTDDADLADQARQLVAKGHCEVVVISLGAGGVLVVSAESSERIASPTVPIRSKVGAGDSLLAGLVLGLERGWPLAEAARLGVAAGSAAVMTPGSELCRRRDAERLFAQLMRPAT